MGEYPQAADTAGFSGSKVRYFAVITSGCLAMGGAYLSLVQVSAGKKIIAIAALIFGKWHPLGSVASLLFGATEALGVNIPDRFLIMLPYAIALLALIGLVRKSSSPQQRTVIFINFESLFIEQHDSSYQYNRILNY